MAELMGTMHRTVMCGEVDKRLTGEKVTLMGWVHSRRDLGALVFITLRDRTGIVQCVFDESDFKGDYRKVESIRGEYVLALTGTVALREERNINPNMKTGEIEVKAEDVKILSEAETPPFYIQDGINTREELRLQYRYLDLRRPEMQERFLLRHKPVSYTHLDVYKRQHLLQPGNRGPHVDPPSGQTETQGQKGQLNLRKAFHMKGLLLTENLTGRWNHESEKTRRRPRRPGPGCYH